MELREINPIQKLWEGFRESRLAKVAVFAGIAVSATVGVVGCGEQPHKFHCPPQDVNRDSVNGGCHVMVSDASTP